MADPRFEVENEEMKAKLRDIGGRIGESLPPGWGFSLFLEEHSPGNATFYISSMQRESNAKALHEFIERQCAGEPGCSDCGCPSANWEKNPDGKGYKTV